VDVTLENAKTFGLVLSGEGGSASVWRCCWGVPDLPQPFTLHPPFPNTFLEQA
jgi:hypothetical protein